MQPIDPDKKPAVHTTPLNHIGLWIDDLPRAVEWLAREGVRFAPGGIRKGAAGHDICFVHPKGNDEFPVGGEGVLIELVQAPPEVIARSTRSARGVSRVARSSLGCFEAPGSPHGATIGHVACPDSTGNGESMTVREILKMGDPRLLRIAKPVEAFGTPSSMH